MAAMDETEPTDVTQMDKAAIDDFNRPVIDEFRANGGVVGGDFAGIPLLLLHHTGARSGVERVTPLVRQDLDEGWAIFASAGGSPKAPDWYHNVVANPHTTIEVGDETVEVTAVVADPETRAPIWERQKAVAPQFADYEKATTRTIPVVVVKRR